MSSYIDPLGNQGFHCPRRHIESFSVMSSSLQPHGLYSGEGNSSPLQDSCLEIPVDRGALMGYIHGVTESDMTERLWNSPGQNTREDSLSLLQGIFPTQGLNPGLPHCRWILYQLSQKGSPRILERVAYPFFRGSSQARNQPGSPAS